MARFSTTASIIQSQSCSLVRSSSTLPMLISRALFGCMNGAGSACCNLAKAVCAITLRSVAFGGTMSSNNTAIPALARCAAIPAPMTPAPITAALRMLDSVFMVAFMTQPPELWRCLVHRQCIGWLMRTVCLRVAIKRRLCP